MTKEKVVMKSVRVYPSDYTKFCKLGKEIAQTQQGVFKKLIDLYFEGIPVPSEWLSNVVELAEKAKDSGSYAELKGYALSAKHIIKLNEK